jgi:hypothetical protein
MEFWWEKNWDDVNGLPTLKKHSQFEICEIWNLKKIKNLLNKILRFQKSFTTCQWGVMYMTSKEIFYFMIKEKKSYNN